MPLYDFLLSNRYALAAYFEVCRPFPHSLVIWYYSPFS